MFKSKFVIIMSILILLISFFGGLVVKILNEKFDNTYYMGMENIVIYATHEPALIALNKNELNVYKVENEDGISSNLIEQGNYNEIVSSIGLSESQQMTLTKVLAVISLRRSSPPVARWLYLAASRLVVLLSV